MLKDLKKLVIEGNRELPKLGLVKYSWGNVSGISRSLGVIVIKPVGMPYEELTMENISVVDLKGKILEGGLPSVDLPTHMELYRAFPECNAIVHTHSTYATMWAQACMSLPCFGTTHADYFYRDVPCTRILRDDEITDGYEKETGKVIVETFNGRNPSHTPAVLVANHGPFTWGKDVFDAVHKSVVLEETAKIALGMRIINPSALQIGENMMEKHYFRKHGPNAYFINDDHGRGRVSNV
ncbi:MAG: L-ribulose-5-phosphate 4-epimerase AraD [Firmicutes bacterium]|nr:L-ribulose-5-phosphate 4-epimerase AraD [Bacillota bacterium]